jgi:hypothetical protein
VDGLDGGSFTATGETQDEGRTYAFTIEMDRPRLEQLLLASDRATAMEIIRKIYDSSDGSWALTLNAPIVAAVTGQLGTVEQSPSEPFVPLIAPTARDAEALPRLAGLGRVPYNSSVQTIDVHDLPEPVAKAIEAMVQSLRQTTAAIAANAPEQSV